MATMNISLPDALKDFVETRVAEDGYGTTSEYVRELIRRELHRHQLRTALLEGAASDPLGPADESYFSGLRRDASARPTR